jgi:hypothetical protein
MSVTVGAAASEGLALTTDSRTMQQRKEGSSSHYRVEHRREAVPC